MNTPESTSPDRPSSVVEHERPEIIPPAASLPLGRIARRVVVCMLVLLSFIGAASVINAMLKAKTPLPQKPAMPARRTDEEIAIENAKDLLLSGLSNPDAVKFLAVKVRDHKDSYYLTQLLAEGENGFGARIRSNYCVVLELSSDKIHYFYNKDYAVQTCSNPPSDSELSLIRSFNHWGQKIDRSNTKIDDRLTPEQ